MNIVVAAILLCAQVQTKPLTDWDKACRWAKEGHTVRVLLDGVGDTGTKKYRAFLQDGKDRHLCVTFAFPRRQDGADIAIIKANFAFDLSPTLRALKKKPSDDAKIVVFDDNAKIVPFDKVAITRVGAADGTK